MPKISTHTDPVLERVRALVAPLCVAHRVDLVDVAWFARTLRVTIERKSTTGKEDPAGTSGWGVSLDDCAELSRDISRALDENDTVPGAYSLEVSSPGLERVLYDDADFRRFVGFLAKVKLSRPAADGQKLLRGTIEAVSEPGGADLQLKMRVDNKIIVVPFETVTAAHLVYELPTAGASRAGGGAAKSKKDKRRVSQKGV
jgi:ribosome maturation factor RimP